MPLKGRKVIAFPEALHDRVKEAAHKSHMTIEAAAAAMFEEALTKDSKELPPSDSLALLPEAVLQLLRTHWKDSSCKKCLLALARIFAVGDQEVIRTITSTCEQFRALSTYIQESNRDDHNWISSKAEIALQVERQLRAVLEEEQLYRPRAFPGEEAPGNPPDGSSTVPPMGNKPRRRHDA